jgi:glycosyltransferase involved in cell wall biosynthesis
MKTLIAVDTFDWAFHTIAKQIAKAYGDRHEIEIIDRRADFTGMECDVALFFWWKSGLAAMRTLKAKRWCIGMYDHWSIAAMPHEFAKLAPHADCFFAGNEIIAADLALRAPGKQIEVTEDGVDMELFTPQPLPEEFTLGWAGNRVYESIGLGDFKGVKLIEEAARRCNIPLVIQDKQVKQIPQADMPEQFYRRISCYVCASVAEGTPVPVLEAKACGRHVVSTRVGIVPKVVPAKHIAERTVEGLVQGIQNVRQSPPSMQISPEWDWKNKALAFGPVLEG